MLNEKEIMKKMFLIFGLALGMLTVACSTDTTQDVLPQPQNEVVLGVTLEEASRTQIGAATETGYKTVWSEGDCVMVNDKRSSEIPAEFVGTQSARFTVSDVKAPYNIVYPADVVKHIELDGDTYNYAIYSPAKQEYADHSFADKLAVMTGWVEDASAPVALTHVFGFVKVSVAKGDDVALHSVTLETLDETPISGDLWVHTTTLYTKGFNYIHISSATGIPYTDGKAEVIFAIPANTYAKGFKVTIEDETGKVMERTAYSTSGVTIAGGELLAMPTLTYKGEAKSGIVIRTAEQLVAFRDAFKAGDFSAYVNEDGEVTLGADIDMEGVTNWTSIGTANFGGVFNGKGYKIKNWKTSEPLFTGITGTIKNVVVDKSCTFTVATKSMASGDKQCAFLVGKVHPAGTAYGCVNFGEVNATQISNGTHRVAGLFGAGYGFINDCVNYGNISVTNDENMPNNLMVGGVVAYYNTNSGTKNAFGKSFLKDCSNYGKVKVNFPDGVQPKNVYVGGVLGTTTYSKSSAATNQGTIENCHNYGDVEYHFEELAGGTYGNVGGVIGYAEAKVQSCENFGSVKYTVPTTDLTVGGTRPAIGGVVATALYSVDGCYNYGEVYVEGVWAGGTEDNPGAGSYAGAVFGGVVGCAGIYIDFKTKTPAVDVETTDKISNCHNEGKFTTKYYCKTGGGTATSEGGVVGYSQMPVENCSNSGVVSISTFCKNTYVGGVVGYSTYNVTSCGNDGSVSLNLMGMTATDANFRAGGVVGYCYISTVVSKCYNTGDVTTNCDGVDQTGITIYSASVVGDGYVIDGCSNSGSNVTNIKTKTAYSTLYTAGVAGYSRTSVSNCTMSGSHTLNTDDSMASVRCAGIVGQIITLTGDQQPITNCNTTKTATVTLNTENSKANYTGGVIGLSNNGIGSCTNEATVTVNITKKLTDDTRITYVGGVAGLQKQTMSDCTNKGNITVDMKESVVKLYAGTVLGHNYGTSSVAKKLTNSGTMTITNAPNTDNINTFVGFNEGTIEEANLTNTGKVIVNGTEL